MESELIEVAKKIRLIALDVDGVLTDGCIIYDSHGNESKNFFVRDGSAIFYALKLGFKVAVISGRNSKVVTQRAEELGITEVYQGIKQKWECLQEIMAHHDLTTEQTAYFGDDLLDLQAMRKVAFAVAPADAAPEVRTVAKLITQANGGRGAVREGIEFLLKAQGCWDGIVDSALVDS